jgi:hypothetical protein
MDKPFSLSPSVFTDGERVGVRGGSTPYVAQAAAPHPDPLPVKNGERE